MDRPRGPAAKTSGKSRDVDGQTPARPGVPLARTFPTVASIAVRVAQLGSDSPERVFRTGELGATIECTDPLCDGGGFHIRGLVEEMVRKREKTREEMATCIGNERLPGRGKRPGRVRGHCTRIYRVRIDVKYRSERS